MQRSTLVLLSGAAIALCGVGLYARISHVTPVPAPPPAPSARVAPPPRAPRPPPSSRQRPTPARASADVLAALRAEKDPAARRVLVNELTRYPDAARLLRGVFQEHTDGAAREQALIAAALVGDSEAVAFLADLSADETYGPRAGAALGTVSDAAAAPALAGLLRSNAPVLVRANAARALGAAGTEQEATELAKLVEDAGQPLRVRQEAALALGRIRDPSVVPALVAALERAVGDPSQDAVQLRISIIQGLGNLGTDPAREALGRHQQRPLSEVERAFTERALSGTVSRPQKP